MLCLISRSIRDAQLNKANLPQQQKPLRQQNKIRTEKDLTRQKGI